MQIQNIQVGENILIKKGAKENIIIINSTVPCIRVCSNNIQEDPLACMARRTNTTQGEEILRNERQWVPEVDGCRCLRQRKIAEKEKQKGNFYGNVFICRVK